MTSSGTGYTYYVSYSHPTGFGATAVTYPEPLATWDAVMDLSRDIAARNTFTGPAIVISFQLLTAPTAPTTVHIGQ
ncbi:hypothetical protein AB0I28_09695 [Phytomonospora sp. NPDC050363]|uniref:hypothetical protein n=1 Tax=Phytomonospora sp. NPDC050363 TaxID=3155642 RepID=UPI0033D17236